MNVRDSPRGEAFGPTMEVGLKLSRWCRNSVHMLKNRRYGLFAEFLSAALACASNASKALWAFCAAARVVSKSVFSFGSVGGGGSFPLFRGSFDGSAGGSPGALGSLIFPQSVCIALAAFSKLDAASFGAVQASKHKSFLNGKCGFEF